MNICSFPLRSKSFDSSVKGAFIIYERGEGGGGEGEEG